MQVFPVTLIGNFYEKFRVPQPCKFIEVQPRALAATGAAVVHPVNRAKHYSSNSQQSDGDRKGNDLRRSVRGRHSCNV